MRNTVPVTKEGSQLRVGQKLSAHQLKVLQENSPTPDDILGNMDLLNEELEETYPSLVTSEETTVNRKQPQMNLDDELDELDNTMSKRAAPAAAEPQVSFEEQLRSKTMELLKGTSGAPSDAQINAWKQQHGATAVNVLAIGEGDVYIFTHLKRKQWQKIQEMMRKANEQGSQDVEEQLKEKVVQHCTLWPKLSIEFLINSRAGVIDSLYQAIMTESYFLNQQQISLLTFQL